MTSAIPAAGSQCADLFSDSPLAGTAEVVDVWILLEERRSWPAKAISAELLPATLHDWLLQQVAAFEAVGLRARPQLIRQESSAAQGRRLLLGYGGKLYAAEPRSDAQLCQLQLATMVRERDALPIDWQILQQPRYFVCTNGRRDQCCARLGLPIYRRLRALVGLRAWRTTHVGGHRFAANVLTLADGAVYGRVQEADCAALVREVDSGALAFPWLRGRSGYPQHVQAAEVLLGEQGLKLLHVQGDEVGAQVEFAGAQGRHQIRVARSPVAHEVLAGCDKTALKAIYPFEQV